MLVKRSGWPFSCKKKTSNVLLAIFITRNILLHMLPLFRSSSSIHPKGADNHCMDDFVYQFKKNRLTHRYIARTVRAALDLRFHSSISVSIHVFSSNTHGIHQTSTLFPRDIILMRGETSAFCHQFIFCIAYGTSAPGLHHSSIQGRERIADNFCIDDSFLILRVLYFLPIFPAATR